MNKIELLAPCGNMEALKAAVFNGANAVYLGGLAFGARAYASNFNHEQMIEAINYAHLHQVAVYVTMNTLIDESLLTKALEEVDFLYHNDVDALIIQDLGLLNLIKKHYPDLEIHASTQLHIHNENGIKAAINAGFSRVVIARETSIENIKKCCQYDIEIEAFVYGAQCVSYSGQCLFSSINQNRSGNKGVCAQSCRMKYSLYNEEKQCAISLTDDYLLSLKDLNLINHVPQLIEAGVKSFKIEGRMKRPEYVALVTKTFREAIDAYYNQQKYVISKQRLNELKLMFNRNFTNGYTFHQNGAEVASNFRPNHLGVPIGKVILATKNYLEIKLSAVVNQHDGIRILDSKEDKGLILNKIYLNNKLVKQAMPGQIIRIYTDFYVLKNSLVLKTSDALLLKQLNSNNNLNNNPIKIQYHGLINDYFYLTISTEKNTVSVKSEEKLSEAINSLATKEKIEKQLIKVNDTPFYVSEISGEINNVFIANSILNKIRREAINKLIDLERIWHKRSVQQNPEVLIKPIYYNATKIVEKINTKEFIIDGIYKFKVNSVVDEYSTNLKDNVLASFNDLGIKNHSLISHPTFNIYNSEAIAFLLANGVSLIGLSYELSPKQIDLILQSFVKKYGFYPSVYSLNEGYRDLMVMKYDFLKQHNLANLKHLSLVDLKNNHFPIYYDQHKMIHLLENNLVSKPKEQHVIPFTRVLD